MSPSIQPIFTGCATALVTPFLPDGSLDLPALRTLISIQKNAGVDAIVLLGTTGEPCTLSTGEREQVIRAGVDAAGSLPVIVGTGSNNTAKAIEYARQARELGAAAQLSVTPYYNKCTQSGLVQHYSSIMDHCDLPLIAYSVPARTGMAISPQALAELSMHPVFAGVKEASGDAAAAADMIAAAGDRAVVYCGNDDQILSMMAMGACGAISVVSNILPVMTRRLTDACLARDLSAAASLHSSLLPFIRALFLCVNPIPVKAALSYMGLIDDVLRLPLTPMEDPHRSKLFRLLEQSPLFSDCRQTSS